MPFTVKCWADASEPWALLAPTSLRYRVDDLDSGCNVVAWTDGTLATSQTITIPGTSNTPTQCTPRRRYRLTVQVNVGLSTVAVQTRDYFVRNNIAITA